MQRRDRHEIRLAGSGGQGVILATVILAEAAVMSGRYAAQSQSYGPEARGGSSKAEALISDDPIGFTKVQRPTLFAAFTQKALDLYIQGISDDCLVIIDASLAAPAGIAMGKLIVLPLLATAREIIGRVQTANIVLVGCINEFLEITDDEAIRLAMLRHIPKGSEKLNIQALEEGKRLARDWKKDDGL